MNITETILNDHATRKGTQGASWFTAADLARLGLTDPLFSVFQNVQHTLKCRRLPFAVEADGCLDRWSLADCG